MTSVSMAVVAFVCALSGAAIGMGLRSRLPEHHLNRDSTDVIKLATGLVATLVALVLGLLISSANSTRLTVQNEYKGGRAQVVQLDRYLAAYGPPAAGARAALRQAFAEIFAHRWPREDFGIRAGTAMGPRDELIAVTRAIIALQPASDEQKWFRTEALHLTVELAQLYRLILSQEASSEPPWVVLFMVTICAVFIFASFGLFAAPNPTVVVSFVIAALAVGGAMFLIIDLGDPFDGVLSLSSEPSRVMLGLLGK